MLFGKDIDRSGGDGARQAELMGDARGGGERTAGVTSFLRASRDPTHVVENNTLECTTWARDNDPSLGGPKTRLGPKAQPRKANGLARTQASS